MDLSQPPTIEEALKLDKSALVADITRRRQNIQLFQDEIRKDEAAIQWDSQAITIIDANKPNHS